MVADTAFFRNPRYYRPSDRPETLGFWPIGALGPYQAGRELGPDAGPSLP